MFWCLKQLNCWQVLAGDVVEALEALSGLDETESDQQNKHGLLLQTFCS